MSQNQNIQTSYFSYFIKFVTLVVIISYVTLLIVLRKRKSKNENKKLLKIGFLHPYCNDGGGGQKVLWFIIKSLIDNINPKHLQICVYSLQPNKMNILERVQNRFNVDLRKSSKFGTIPQNQILIIHVEGKNLLKPQKFLTMVFHMILPMIYTIKCLLKYQPDIFYDSTGFAFSFFSVKLLLPKTLCFAYVHYPFISYDMIKKISQKRNDFNNSKLIAKYSILTKLKIYYYWIILYLYKQVGKVTDFSHANSTWTFQHMIELWQTNKKTQENKIRILYPPCNVTPLLNIQRNNKNQEKQLVIMSFAQFRPQKRQKLQVDIYNQIVQHLKNNNWNKKLPILLIVGASRGFEDQKIVQQIKQYSKSLNLDKQIMCLVNQPYPKILQIFQKADYGIHTMQAQHFGISIVQMMSAGLIVVAHNSAGPKTDIIEQGCGFLASDKDEYVKHFTNILSKNIKWSEKQMIGKARKRVKQFSDESFMNNFIKDFNQQIQKSYLMKWKQIETTDKQD